MRNLIYVIFFTTYEADGFMVTVAKNLSGAKRKALAFLKENYEEYKINNIEELEPGPGVGAFWQGEDY